MVEVETLPGEGDQHQADPEDITLPERYDPSANLFNCCCERFETEGDDNDDDEMVEIPIPSPPRQDQRQQPGVMHGENVQPLRGRRRKRQASVLDNDQTIIPSHVYQSWIKDPSDIVSRRRRNPKPKNIMSTVNIMPASVLMGGLFKPASGETYYPPPLLELWKGKPTHDSPRPPALESLPLPPEPSSWSPDTPAEGFYGGHSSQPFTNHDVPPELMDELIANLDRMSGDDINLATPENSGDERRSIPSTSSGKGVNKNSSRKRSNDGLEPVSDDNGCHHRDPNLKASRLSGNGPTLEQELLMETGPTQTQESIFDMPLEKMTDEVRKELKSHFETPGGPQAESLDNMTAGKNRREAALLFYQTCVLATRDFVKVEQKGPYEDILITPVSRTKY